jgi:hypothetical protein
MLVGGALVALAVVHIYDTRQIAEREPTVATAADLCRKEYTDSAPDWIAYTFAESKPTEVTVTRQRLGNGGDVQARCILVRVEDKWLAATVAPGFEGNNLVGRIVPLDSSMVQSLNKRLSKLAPKQRFALLPFEFNAVDGSASDQRLRYAAAGWIGFFGLVGLLVGLFLFRAGRRTVQINQAPASAAWTYQPVPNRS